MAKRTNTAKKVEEQVVETPAVVEAPKVVYPTFKELDDSGFKSKSQKIRELGRLGAKPGEITKIFTDAGQKMIYQHAYNVLHKELKRPAPAAVVETPKVETPAAEGEGSNPQEA